MPKFTENGITVEFQSDYFQFEKCDEYKKISGLGVKEMDFGWFDKSKNTLWLIELKGFMNPNPNNLKFKETNLSNVSIIDEKINELLMKSIHSVCMLENKRSNTYKCFDKNYNFETKIKLVHILNIKKEYIELLDGFKFRLEKEFKAYKAIFNINSITVIDYNKAKEMFNFVI